MLTFSIAYSMHVHSSEGTTLHTHRSVLVVQVMGRGGHKVYLLVELVLLDEFWRRVLS